MTGDNVLRPIHTERERERERVSLGSRLKCYINFYQCHSDQSMSSNCIDLCYLSETRSRSRSRYRSVWAGPYAQNKCANTSTFAFVKRGGDTSIKVTVLPWTYTGKLEALDLNQTNYEAKTINEV